MRAVNLPAFPDVMPWPCLDDRFDRALKVLPGVGHSAIPEAPEQCMALIAPFLSTGALP
jgi:pimeloyl-ACP methyl ester carboxylesterase